MTSRTPSEHPVPDRVVARIWENVDVREPEECWPWRLSFGSHGYGQVGWSLGDGRNAMTTAHRVVWIATHGPIPERMTVDHNKDVGCSGGGCCNPAHLRIRSNIENATDNGQGRKTHCPKGHPYEGENLIIESRGWRRCRVCRDQANRNRKSN